MNPRYKIISDGMASNTRLIDLKTGEELPCTDIHWSIDVRTGHAKADVRLVSVAVEAIAAEATMGQQQVKGLYNGESYILTSGFRSFADLARVFALKEGHALYQWSDAIDQFKEIPSPGTALVEEGFQFVSQVWLKDALDTFH